MNGNILRLAGTLAVLLITACGGVTPGNGNATDQSSLGTSDIAKLDSDLSEGASGPAVRELNAFLTRYGYFPNDALSEDYPAWRPIVAAPPASPDVFDEATTKAVRALQANYGFPQTGVLDRATRKAVTSPRCGVPDGIPRLDPSAKYDYTGYRFSGPVTWSITGGVGDSHAAAAAAFAAWRAETNLVINEAPAGTTATMQITYGHLGATGPYASTRAATHHTTINLDQNWTINPFAESVVMLHEIGHLLGLNHSGWWPSVMYPDAVGQENIDLNIDDKVGISLLYDVPTSVLNGWAIDIAAGVTVGSNPTVWKIGTDSRIYQWVGGLWVADASGGQGQRITVAYDGHPWIVGTGTGGGAVWRYSTTDASTGHWVQQTGTCATDIAAWSEVWIIGCSSSANHPILWLKNGTFQPVTTGAAVRISVDPFGVPWVVNASNNIFRLASKSLTAAWQTLPGLALDIGVASGASTQTGAYYAWVVGTDGNIYSWQEQPDYTITGSLSTDARAVAAWPAAWGQVPNARAIAVGSKGEPWVINSSNALWTDLN